MEYLTSVLTREGSELEQSLVTLISSTSIPLTLLMIWVTGIPKNAFSLFTSYPRESPLFDIH